MPIRYESAQFGGGLNYNSQGGGGGGGGGAGLTAYQDPRVQVAADQNQLEYLKLIQNRAMAGATGRDAYAADSALELQNNRFYLQSWLNQQEMTQAEQLKLRQDKNAIAMIQAQVGKNLTQEQADDLSLQKVTGINVAQNRLNRQQAEAQAKALAANEQLHLAQAKTLQRSLDISGKSFEERTLIKVPTQVAMRIGAEFDKIYGKVPPDDIEGQKKRLQMVRQEAVRTGDYHEFFYQADGKLEPFGGSPAIGDRGDERGGANPGQSKGASSSSSSSKGTDYSKPFDAAAAKRQVEAELTGEISKDDPGYDKRVGQGIEEAKKKYEAAKAATTPEGKAATAQASSKAFLDKHETLVEQAMKRTDLTDNRKMAVAFIKKAMDQAIIDSGPYEQMRPQMRAYMDRLAIDLQKAMQPDIQPNEPLRDRVASPGGSNNVYQPSPTDPVANARRFGVEGGSRPVMSSDIPTSQAIGNIGRNLIEIIGEAAPDLSPEARKKLYDRIHERLKPKR